MEIPGALGLAYAALVIIGAYAVRSTAGFGGQAFAVPLLVLVLPLQIVIPAITVVTALASFDAWRRDWRRIVWPEILRLLPFTLAGVIMGIYLFNELDPRTLVRAFGYFVIGYACFALATAGRSVKLPGRYARVLGAALSALSGLIGAIFGAAAGPLYVVYFNALGLEKDSFRITVTTILTFQATFRVIGYAKLGLYDWTVVAMIVACLPLMLIGSRIGVAVAGRIGQRTFNFGVAGLLLFSGVALLFK